MLYLMMALCWLLLGVVLLAWQAVDPARFTAYIWGTRIPLGWLGIAIGLYDLLHWRFGRSTRIRSGRARQDALRQPRAGTQRSPRPTPPPDPNFDFTPPGRS